MTEIISIRRRFQVWSYAVGHGLLLLRSTKNGEHDTQVDVLFTNVSFLSLPTLFEHLHILLVPKEEWKNLPIQVGVLGIGDRNCYQVSGIEWSGYVVAGNVLSVENTAEYFNQSVLIEASN
jgi:hypothetical protein